MEDQGSFQKRGLGFQVPMGQVHFADRKKKVLQNLLVLSLITMMHLHYKATWKTQKTILKSVMPISITNRSPLKPSHGIALSILLHVHNTDIPKWCQLVLYIEFCFFPFNTHVYFPLSRI